MRIMVLDCEFQVEECQSYKFESPVSAFDFDIVIWDVEGTANRLGMYADTFHGLPSLDTAQTVSLLDAINRRREEFRELVELGRVVAVLASGSEQLFIDTGKRRTSGTGRNEKSVKLVDDIHLLSFVIPSIACERSRGLEIDIVDERVRSLWRTTAEGWIYRGIMTKWPGDALLRVKGTNKVVGSIEEHASGGCLVVLPEPWVPDSDDEDDAEEVAADTAPPPEDEPVVLNTPPPAGDEQFPDDADTEDRLFNAKELVRWLKGLTAEAITDVPEWLHKFALPEQAVAQEETLKLLSEMAVLEEKREKLRATDAESNQWKRLVASDGLALEQQVVLAFQELGFEALTVLRGRSDLRLLKGEQKFVVEVKGTRKSAAEKHAAQLEKWVAEEIATGSPAKGILVVNGWRDLPLNERTEAVFPAQMIAYSTARSHCLISGLQLLSLVRAVGEGQLTAHQVGIILEQTNGCLDGWNDWTAVFKETSPAIETVRSDR